MTAVAIISIGRNNLSGLKSTVQSVLDQATQPAQFIIIDGASTDGTLEWLQSQSLPNYCTIVSEADEGIYDALNKGLSIVNSELALFTNSGDRLAGPNTLTQVVDSYRNFGWKWAFGDSLLESNAGQPDRHHRLKDKRWLKFICGIGSVPHQATVMSKQTLEEIGGFDLNAGVCADQEHVLRAWLSSAPHYLNFTVAVCEAAGISSEQRPGHFARHMQVYRRQHGIVLGVIKPVDSLITKFAEFWNRTRQRPAQ